nr:synaptobrevin, longin-like domain protein [Tanacetum cinerariifolium]
MVAIVEKGEHNIDFHPMVDFIEASPLSYALTFKHTIYVSYIRQFWSTAKIETTEEGTKILATVNGILRTVTKSSLRRNLKLQDEDEISSLPDTELFENLSLMGYNISQNQKFTFQKGQFSHQWKYLIHTIMQCLSPKSTWFNEFSSNIATALVCLTTNRTYNFCKMIFDGLVKNINNKGAGSGTPTEPHHTPSPEAPPSSHTHISSPSLPTSFALPPVADKPASPVRDVSQGEACPTKSGFIADQDKTTIAMSSTLPYDSATRVTSHAAAREMEINKLKERVKLLEDGKGMAVEGSRNDAPIKGRRLDEEEVATERVSSDTEEIRLDEGEVAVEKVSDDTEELATVLITMEAASVLSNGGVQVVPTAAAVAPANVSISTGSRVVPTASTTISTATPIIATATTVTPYTTRKGKEKMVETHTPKKKKRVQEQIDIQFARELEEELEREAQRMNAQIYQGQQSKSRTKKQKRDFYMAIIRNNLGWKVKDFKGMSFDEVEAKFKIVWEQIEGGVSKISEGEAAWLKRKGIRSEHESAKKQKTTEEVPEEVKSYDEIPEEKIKELIRLILIEEVYVEALHIDREDLNQLWALVKEKLSIRPTTDEKEMELWVELKRLYEPDVEDHLWTHFQHIMHAPVDWRLYDTCGVHHVMFKDLEIFMLVEKNYPLRKALALVMIYYKLQVENYSQMATDLVRKIQQIAAKGSGDDAPIKGKRLDEEEIATERVSSDTEEIKLDEREVAIEKVSDDTEELATVLITMDAASVLSSGGV